jgi:hypothetical protein
LAKSTNRKDWDFDDDFFDDDGQPQRGRSNRGKQERLYRAPSLRQTELEEFKCGHCKTFVGPPISGGRQRNHCPLCLYSKHVDHTPGDRKNECRSLMKPIGTAFRRNGEQVIVHECLGCGEVRYCRVAADDHMILCAELPVLDLPTREQGDALDEILV